MKLKLTLILCIFLSICTLSIGQTTDDFFHVKNGNGNGIRFWGNNGDDFYKMHMGFTPLNIYGPVTGYSIKTNMSNHTTRGWVWGTHNKKPVTALNTLGNFQTSGWMKIENKKEDGSYYDATKNSGSGGLEIAGTLRIDGNEIITNTNDILYLNQDNNGDVIMDGGTFRVDASHNLVKLARTRDASKTPGSGALEIGGSLRLDGNEMITNENTVLYLNKDNNGDVNVDNGTFKVDASKNMVGVGLGNTAVPYSKFVVKSAANQRGIESNSPHGRSYFPFSDGLSYLTGKGIVLRTTNNVSRLRVQSDGKIVIGSVPSTPGNYKLYVQNGMLAEKVRVAVKGTADWADYVFEDDYDVMPIAQLDEYISENKHLPNVPSAEEVVEHGLDVAQMDAKLLEKIEEAYLYIIDLQKQIDDLKSNQQDEH